MRWPLRPTGGFYAGTSPDGKVYRVARDGTTIGVLRPGRQVHLVPGRGPRRHRCSWRPGRRASSIGSRPTARARCSTRRGPPTSPRWPWTQTGSLLAATSSPGQVLRIDRRRAGLRAVGLAICRGPRAAPGSQGRGLRHRRQQRREPRPLNVPPPLSRRRQHRFPPSPPRSRSPPSATCPSGRPDRPCRRARGESRRDAVKGAIYRIPADGALGDVLGSHRRHAVRPRARAGRGPACRDGQQGSPAAPGGRPGPRDGGGPRRGAANHLAGRDTPTASCTSRRPTRARCSAVARTPWPKAPTSRTCATQPTSPRGARFAGARSRRRGRPCSC